MSDYITLAKIRAALPADITAQLLDDNKVGVADPSAWPAILDAVTTEINGKLAQRYALPLADPLPELITTAAFILAAELVYQRRGFYDTANPWSKRAEGIRGTVGQQGGQPGLLDKLASGEVPLLPALKPAKSQAAAITSPAKTTPSSGAILC